MKRFLKDMASPATIFVSFLLCVLALLGVLSIAIYAGQLSAWTLIVTGPLFVATVAAGCVAIDRVMTFVDKKLGTG